MVSKHAPNKGYAPNKDAIIKPRPNVHCMWYVHNVDMDSDRSIGVV